MADSYDKEPPHTDRYVKAWEIIDANGGPDAVSSVECINKHVAETYRRTKKNTRNKYLGELNKFDRILKERGHNPLPWTIDESVVEDLLNEVWKNRAVSTKKWYTHILNRYLEFYGNRVVDSLCIQWPQDTRPNVKWLSDDEYERLRALPKSPLEDVVIALELGMGLRSVEVCRLRMCDIHRDNATPYINVRGKGRGEGKWRSVPFGNDMNHALDRWLERRKEIVAKMHEYDAFWEEPQELVIWSHYISRPDAGPYSEQGNSLNRGPIAHLNEKAGFKFTQHTLRRTFGRRMFHAGVKIETISKLLGHDDTATTYKYLGLNMDDMTDAMKMLENYDQRRD